jgi:glycosyltransferase involved in cell wall biosynthesis
LTHTHQPCPDPCVRGLVSVVIPVYNTARFLAETVESVLAQTYICWELILVDDGSTDGSTAIAREYAARYPGSVQYLEHPGHSNIGVCATRNLGIERSKGEYIALLDSDDVWLPRKLQEQVALMEAHPEAGMVFGRFEFWYDWAEAGRQTGKNRFQLLPPGGPLYAPSTLLKLFDPFGPADPPSMSDVLLRRSAIVTVGGFDEEFDSSDLYEDNAFLTKIYVNVPVIAADTCWDRYRMHDASCCHIAERNGSKDQCLRLYFEWLQRYFRRHNVLDREIGRLVRRRIWAYRLPRLAAAVRPARNFVKTLSKTLLRYPNRLLTRAAR